MSAAPLYLSSEVRRWMRIVKVHEGYVRQCGSDWAPGLALARQRVHDLLRRPPAWPVVAQAPQAPAALGKCAIFPLVRKTHFA